VQLPLIPKELRAGASLPGELRSQSGLRVWTSLLSALARNNLTGLSVLDIGCGDRLTHAIVELELPVGSYVGVDNRKPAIDWLNANVGDPRCSYAHFDVYHVLYWSTGKFLSKRMELPAPTSDVIFAQSVFSHLYPHETDIMLALARRKAHTNTQLVFTCFLSESVTLFEDRHGDKPALRYYYHPETLRTLLRKNGWEITCILPPGEPGFGQGEQNAVVCRTIEPLPLPDGFG